MGSVARARRVLAVGAIAAAATSLESLGVASAQLPAGNLLTNPGAEAGSCADASTPQQPIPGWTATGSFTVVCYASGTTLDPSASSAINGGNAYFLGGDTTTSSATQTVDVSANASEIDAGHAAATLSGYLGGFDSQDDHMTVTATFLSGSSRSVGEAVEIGPVLAADRNDQSIAVLRTAFAPVPAGARSIRVTMTATRVDGSDDDAAADNLSLMLVPPPPPPVNGHSVDVSPVSGTVLIRLRGQKTFTALTAGEQIPVGATIDATNGKVLLVSATGSHGDQQSGDFYGGAFVVGQQHGEALTTLKLTGGDLGRCKRMARDLAGPLAREARRPPQRHLWGSGHGSFRTTGAEASASVRGTIWLTQDDCAGTLVRVKRGVVSVLDRVRHQTIVVHAGHKYFAARKK
jgi:hypothetical protein